MILILKKLKIDIPTFKIDTSIYNNLLFLDSFNKFSMECPYTIENAKKNIKNKNLSIVIHCGFIGCPKSDSLRKKQFLEKYNIEFEYLGCVRGWNIEEENTYGYNELIFNYLSKVYGNQAKTDY